MSIPSDAPSDCTVTLPEHSIRQSGRARRVSLRVLPGKGLEVVLPRNVDPACVPAILARNRTWIDKALRRVLNGRCPEGDVLPEAFAIKGGREIILLHRTLPPGVKAVKARRVREIDVPVGTPGHAADPAAFLSPVRGTEAGRARPGRPALSLTSPAPRERHVLVPDGEPETARRLLKEWIRGQASAWLGPMLEEVAATEGFSHAGAGFRFQKSRWGSCSARGRISLNACLLFLPEHLARYILLHELCHTRELNHSPAFWKHVFAVDPDALAKDKAMRAAWKYVPGWVWM